MRYRDKLRSAPVQYNYTLDSNYLSLPLGNAVFLFLTWRREGGKRDEELKTKEEEIEDGGFEGICLSLTKYFKVPPAVAFLH